VKGPCSEDWDQMTGNDRVRFCSHCAKHVNNLSEMTRKEARRLVRDSGGNLCVRYIYEPRTKRPLFAEQLLQITRRTPALAAGVMTASLSMAPAAYSQGDVISPVAAVHTLDRQRVTAGDQGEISGTLTDQNGAVIPFALVSATNQETGQYFMGTTSIEGHYQISGLPAGTYKIKFEAVGFETREVPSVDVSEGGSRVISSSLGIQGVSETVTVGKERGVNWEGGAMGITVCTVTRGPRNPLVEAVESEDIDQVKAVVQMGARINSRDRSDSGITALHAAIENGNVDIAEYLIQRGAKLNARDDLKRTPLMMIDSDATVELVGLLLQSGARADAVDKGRSTVLMHYAEYADSDIVRLLVSYGAQVNAVNKEGKTALMVAAENGSADGVAALLEAGANVNFTSKKGDTALAVAGDQAIRDLLTTYGAVGSR
jgi:hypothetical protein